MLPCQGPCGRSLLLALMLLVTGVQLAPPGIPSAPSGELTAVGESIPAPAKSGDATTTTTTGKSIPAANASSGNTVGGDLLDQQKLTFLAVCQGPLGTVKKGDAMLCEVYRNLSAVLGTRKQSPVTANTVQEMLAEPDSSGTEKFCENLTPVLQALREKGQFGGAGPLEKEAVCANLCLPVDEDAFHVTLKPICRVLLWGFRLLLIPDVAVDPAVRAAQEVVPPLIDEGLKLEKVEPKADAATKPVVKPVQQTSATAHVTPSTNSDAAVAPVVADKPADVKSPAGGDEKTAEDSKKLTEEDETELFVDQEAKNKQNLEDINGEGGLKDGLDAGPADEDGMYPEGGEGDSDEDPSMDTNIPTAAGTAPKEVAVREEDQRQQQQDSLEPQPRLGHKESLQQQQQQELPDPFFEESDSNFFSYFLFVMFACIVCYVGYHNKSKLLALALEGRRSSTGRGGFSKGRKHTAAYRKLDSNLEEAIMSNSAASSRSQQQIIY